MVLKKYPALSNTRAERANLSGYSEIASQFYVSPFSFSYACCYKWEMSPRTEGRHLDQKQGEEHFLLSGHTCRKHTHSIALSSSTGGLQTERQTRWGWKAQTLKPYLHTACQSRAEPSCEVTECMPWVGGCMGILPKIPGSPWRKLPPALKGKCYPVSRDHVGDLWGQMANGWRGCIPLRVCLKDPGELPGRISIYRVWGISCILWFVPEHRIYYTDRFPVPRHW